MTKNNKNAIKFIRKIEDQYQDNFIYRECNKVYSDKKRGVSSNLYLSAVDKKVKLKDTNSPLEIERLIVESARRHFPTSASIIETLTEIQHYRGITNLIDFSCNLYVALFLHVMKKVRW